MSEEEKEKRYEEWKKNRERWIERAMEFGNFSREQAEFLHSEMSQLYGFDQNKL